MPNNPFWNPGGFPKNKSSGPKPKYKTPKMQPPGQRASYYPPPTPAIEFSTQPESANVPFWAGIPSTWNWPQWPNAVANPHAWNAMNPSPMASSPIVSASVPIIPPTVEAVNAGRSTMREDYPGYGFAQRLSTDSTGDSGDGSSFPGWRGDGYSTNPNYNWWREKYGQTAYKWDKNKQGDLQLYANPNAPFDVAEPWQDIEGRDWSSVYSKDFYANLPATWRGDKARANFKQTYGFSNNPRTGTPYQMVGDNRMIKKGSPDGSGKISQGQLPEQFQNAPQSQPVNLRDVPAWVGSLVNWRT